MGWRLGAVEGLGMIERAYWQGRRVLLTGHTGFKGAWLSLWLEQLGAQVYGLALAPDTEPSLYDMLGPMKRLRSRLGDIRDPTIVAEAVDEARPQIVIHMAAQSLVRRSYRAPVETVSTNVMGTVHLLNSLRTTDDLEAVVIVTTDKVYRDDGQERAHAEDDPLGGADLYSGSKAATEIVVASMRASFFTPRGVPIATARAGNVVGGGDWSEDRLVPDLWRAVSAGRSLRLRNPLATRPWQHVLEPLSGYLLYAERLARGSDLPSSLNFGPAPDDVLSVADVADTMLAAVNAPSRWVADDTPQPKETTFLAIDPTLAFRTIGWRPRLGPSEALEWTAEWYRAVTDGAEPRRVALDQISRYEALV